jgi:hypothetical protein
MEKTDHQSMLGYVNAGVKQIFERVDLNGPKGADGAVEEVDQRFDWFTKKVSIRFIIEYATDACRPSPRCSSPQS